MKKIAFNFGEVSKLHRTLNIFLSVQKNILYIPKCDTMNTSQILKMGHPSEPGHPRSMHYPQHQQCDAYD